MQENFKHELRSIRSHSPLSQTNRYNFNKSQTGRSDGDGVENGRSITLVSGTMITDEDDISAFDLSGTELIEQSKRADLKLQLLQKQIEMMEKRKRLQELEDGCENLNAS
jgi:hypothetical protein